MAKFIALYFADHPQGPELSTPDLGGRWASASTATRPLKSVGMVFAGMMYADAHQSTFPNKMLTCKRV